MIDKRQDATAPYKGLAPYAEEDSSFFFGRDSDRKVIISNLLGSRLTLLYGASGIGKSSVLRAGVASHLRDLARESQRESGSPEFAVVVFDAWKEEPLSALLKAVESSAAAILGATPVPSPEPADFCAWLKFWTAQLGGELLIILDQFEDYFFVQQREGRDDFAAEFVKAVNAPSLRVNFLISIREDALAWLDRFKGKIPELFENYLRLEQLDRASARQAIERPLQAWEKEGPRFITPQMVDEILNQISERDPAVAEMWRPATPPELAGEQTGIEPSVLQVVMTRLWEEEKKRNSLQLRLETLRALGGAHAIYKDYFVDRLRSLSKKEVYIAGRLFLHLVDLGGARSLLATEDLAARTNLSLDRVKPVLNKLLILRVLAVRSKGRYEVPHDILGLAILQWRQQFDEKRAAARKRRLEWGWVALGFTLLVLAVGLPLWNHQIEHRRRLANAERLAAKALYYSNRRLDLGLLLAAQAARTADSGEVRNGLLSTLQQAPRLKAFLYGDSGGINTLAFDSSGGLLAAGTAGGQVWLWDVGQMKSVVPLRAHASGTRISGLTFYHDKAGGSAILATAGEDGAIYLWDLLRRRPWALTEPSLELERSRRAFSGLTVSSDGRLLAAGVVNGRVLLWDLKGHRRRPRRLEPGGGAGPVVTFIPNGRVLAVGGADGAVRLYDSADASLAKLTGEAGAITSLATDPYGRLLAAGTKTGKLLLWRLRDRRLVSEPVSAHNGAVWSIAFDLTGERLATGGTDHRIRLWTWSKESPNLKAEGDPLTGGHDAGIRGLAFSSDGQILASGGDDGRVCLWSVAENPPLGTRLAKIDGTIEGMAFSPDGQTLASGGSDGHLRLWDVDKQKLLKEVKENGAIWSLAYSPNGSTVAAGGEIGEVRLWEPGPNRSVFLSPHHGRGIEGLAFRPNGTLLAWADLDWTVQLWNLRRKHALPMLTGHTAGVWDIAFNPDGKRLASGGEDQTVRIWDPDRDRQIGPPLAEHSKGVAAVTYSPDGKTLASGGLDGKILLWDPEKQQLIGPMFGSHPSGIPSGISDIAFSPDGFLLASCDQAGRVRLWSALTRQPLGDPLGGHQDEVKSLAFRPDGKILASGGRSGDLFLWDVDFDSWISRACAKANRNMSIDEWHQLVDPEAPYEKTCPDLPPGEGVPADIVSPDKG